MIENEINKRFRIFLFHKKIEKPADLARKMNYSSSEKLSRLFRNSNLIPSTEILLDLANTFADLNLNWLLVGTGEMFIGGGIEGNEIIGGHQITNNGHLNNVQISDQQTRELDECRIECLQRLLEEKNKQLQDKERIIQLLSGRDI